MKKIILLSAGCFMTMAIKAQLYIDNATVFIQPSATIVVQGNVTSNVDIQGTGMLILRGSANQNINMNGFTIPRLEMDNAANATLTGHLRIGTSLYLTNGKIKAGDFILRVNSTGSVSGASASSYIVTDGTGSLKIDNVGASNMLFPVGPGLSLYHPVTLNNTGMADNFSVNVKSLTPPCAPATQTVTTTWDISEETSGGSNCTISLDYTGSAVGSSYSSSGAQIIHCSGTTADYHNGSVTGTVATGSGFTVFSPFGITNNQAILPVNFINVKAFRQGSGIKVEWTNATESNVLNYSIERSANGYNFSSIGLVTARLNNGSRADYGFIDVSPLNAVNYYRIKALESNGGSKYSMIVKVDIKDNAAGISIYPNPVTDGQVSLQATGLAKGQYTVRIFDAIGRKVLYHVIDHNGGPVTEVIQLPPAIQKGVYSLQMMGGDIKLSKAFIIQ